MGVHTVRYGPDYLLELMARHGPVSWWRAFGRRIVAICGPDAVGVVLANKDKAFVTGWPAVIGPWFDGGLLAMDAPAHLTERRLIQTAYADDALAGYLHAMARDVETATDDLPVDTSFRAVDVVRELSGRITVRAFLGVPYDQGGREVMAALEDCIRAESALLRVPLPGTLWRRAHRSRRQLLALIEDAVPAARRRDGQDFLSVLSRIEGLTTTQVVEQMLFTLLAAHDTTTAATLSGLYFLGKNPQWRERVRAQSAAVSTVPRDTAALDAMTDLDMVVRECIRLVSPSPILMRRTVKDTEVLGRFVPAGHLVSVCTAVNQLMGELWPDPQRFDPERFAETRREDRVHRLAWAPFGGGVHKCIGQQFAMLKVKATMDALLRRFDWSFPESYEATWRFTSLPAPADGLPTTLTARRDG